MLEKPIKLDRRVQRTRQLLLQALSDLMAEKSFNNITVQDISERANVNRATFYAHFEDKYALLRQRVKADFEYVIASKIQGTPTFTPENLRWLIVAVYEFLITLHPHCGGDVPQYDDVAILILQVRACVYEVLLRWLDPPQAASAPESTAALLSWAIFGAVFESVQSLKRLSSEQVADHVLSVLTTGITDVFAARAQASE